MKANIWMRVALAAGVLVVLSGVARADGTPTLTIEVDDKLALTGTLKVPGLELATCTVGNETVPVPSNKLIGPVAPESPTRQAALLRDALMRGKISCKPTTGATQDVRLETVKVKNKGAVSTNVPVFAPSFAWEFATSDWGKKILSAFGAAKSCTAAGGDGREIGCTVDASSGEIKVSLAGKPTSGKVVLHLEDKTKQTDITIPIDACRMELRGDLPYLVAGAVGQRVVLAKQNTNSSCSFLLERATKIMIGQSPITLSRTDSSPDAKPDEVERDTGEIPATLAAGTVVAEIHGPGGAIAVAQIDVLPPLRAAEKLFVEYDRNKVSDPFGQLEAASGEAEDRNAVVNPVADLSMLVANKTDIVVPSQLPTAQGAPSSAPNHEGITQFVWAVHNAEGAAAAKFGACHWPTGWTLTGADCTFNDGIGSIKFEVNSTSVQPIKPTFWLVRLQSQVPKQALNSGGIPKPEWTATTLLKAPVEIAKAARRESIALPVRNLLEVECLLDGKHDTTAFANETKAIDEEAVRQGRCRIRVSRERVCAMSRPTTKLAGGSGTDPLYGGIDLYGPQFVKVSIQRGSAERSEVEWFFNMPDADDVAQYCDAESGLLKSVVLEREADDLSRTANGEHASTRKRGEAERAREEEKSTRSLFAFPELTLPAPQEAANATQVYTVEAKVEIIPLANVKYRGGTLERASGQATNTDHGHLRFVTYLRPRGLFGWRCCVRTYITATTQLGGLRFPAEPRELRHSSQSPDYQFVSPRLGILAAVEPWNYDQGINPWAVSPALQVGAHFLNLTDGTVELSSLAGFALTVPLVTDISSQLGAKVTVGAFWEHNFLGKDHLLLSLNLNIGSLLSGSQK